MSDAAPAPAAPAAAAATPTPTSNPKEVKRRLKVTKATKTDKGDKTHRKRRSAKNRNNFTSYIYKVLKAVHPNLGISKKGMAVVNDFANHSYHRLLNEASFLSRYNTKKRTISSRDIQCATRLILGGGELAKHAISGSVAAILKYDESMKAAKAAKAAKSKEA